MAFQHEGPLSAEAEQALMRQLIAGDEDAVRELYSRFGSSIYTLGLRMLGSAQEAARRLRYRELSGSRLTGLGISRGDDFSQELTPLRIA